jgi:hypothetical protein
MVCLESCGTRPVPFPQRAAPPASRSCRTPPTTSRPNALAPTPWNLACSSRAGRRASGFLQVSLSKVSRHEHRGARPASSAETPPMNANDYSRVMRLALGRFRKRDSSLFALPCRLFTRPYVFVSCRSPTRLATQGVGDSLRSWAGSGCSSTPLAWSRARDSTSDSIRAFADAMCSWQIGRRRATEKSRAGVPRLYDPDDWVVREITIARRAGCG